MSELPTNETANKLDLTTLDTTLAVLRSGNFQITHGYTAIDVRGVLGSGGTKTAYDVVIDGQPFALALPNMADDPQKALDKWQVALKEPKATDAMREMGFLVNPVCEEVAVGVNGNPFPAIKMLRYQDMPLQIRDSKNTTSSVIETDLFPEDLSLESFMDKTKGIRSDIGALMQSGVTVGRDSLNICMANGGLRLYFNDLATAKFEPIDPAKINQYVKSYGMFMVGALMNGMGHDEFQRHQGFFDKYFDFEGSGYDQLSSLLMAEAAESR